MSETRGAAAGALLWTLCLQYFVAEAVAIHAWTGAYSLSTNYISDLGAAACFGGAGVCWSSPLRWLMNASFVLQGCLIAGGAALTRRVLPRGALVGAGAGLIGLSGLGVIAVGLAPEDANPAIHYFGAAENLIFCNLGMLALGLAMSVSQGASRLIARAGVAAGVIGLAGLACLASGHYAGIGPGGVERVAAYPFPLWLSATGAWILTARRA